ncbi:imelysin family protein [Aquamicrobium sp. LC103]|uniref:imelysin family protein n=1 Tax=Aquamicrobium sp. LC103 TaxID=1120658 RepID=UPI00069A07C4|nr:imelysin family protein [Aquamicrobium sp. LC103]TKT69344.1 hypothetical protein XW59_027830 [Aquamicrobium sp. LC103]
MKQALLAGAMLILALAPTVAQDQASAIPADIGARVAEGFAAPSLTAFSATANELRTEIGGLCDRPEPARLSKVREAFVPLVAAWGRASMLRFGPLQEENRFERIFFWPDARGVTLRQVEALLAEGDAAVLEPGALAAKSVAVQGLPALEFALFGTGSDTLADGEGSFRCRYALAVAANVEAVAGAIAQAWRPGTAFRTAFVSPSSASDPYRSAEEVAGEIVKAIGTGLQFTRNAELLPALGESIAKARGKRAPFWRSDTTFVLVSAQIEGLKTFAEAAGFAASSSPDVRDAVASLLFDLDHAISTLAEVATPPAEAFGTASDRDRLAYVGVALEGANHTLGENLAAALGLRMGFNALDGD